MDATFLSALANPTHPDRPPLILRDGFLVCSLTGTRFAIVEGIPQLLPTQALPPLEPTASHDEEAIGG